MKDCVRVPRVTLFLVGLVFILIGLNVLVASELPIPADDAPIMLGPDADAYKAPVLPLPPVEAPPEERQAACLVAIDNALKRYNCRIQVVVLPIVEK